MLNYKHMRSLIKLIQKTYHMAGGAKEGKVVLGNVASLSWLQAITYILPIIILPYLFRTLGPDKFGLIAFAQAFIQYFIILTDYSFNVTATKEISLCRENPKQISKVFSSVMTTKMILTLLGLSLLGLIVYCVPKFRNDWPVYVLSFGMVLGSTFFPTWLFQGTERMKYIAITNIIGGLIYTLCIFIFVRSYQDYLAVPIITSGVSLSVGFWGQYYVCKEFKVPFQIAGIREIHRQLISGWDVFLSVLAINAYTTTRIFAVGLLTNNSLTGFYSIAEKIANAVQTFPLSSFSQAIFPRLSKIYHKSNLKALELMEHIQLITIRISLICLPLIFIAAPFIVEIVCGGDYPATILSLRLLIISVFFVASNAFRVQFLLVCGDTKSYSRIHMTIAVMGLPLIISLIYYYSYVGAAVATVIIEGGILMLTLLNVKRIKSSMIAFLACLILLATPSYAKENNMSLDDLALQMKNELNLTDEQVQSIKPILLKYAHKRQRYLQSMDGVLTIKKSAAKAELKKIRKEENEELAQVLSKQQLEKRITKQNLKDSLNQGDVFDFEIKNDDVTMTPQGGAMQF